MTMSDIRPLWTTNIWVGEVTPQPRDRSDSGDDRSPLVLPEGLQGQLEEAARRLLAALRPETFDVEYETRLLHADQAGSLAHVYSPEDAAALVYLTSDNRSGRQESGQIILHDPRAGAANVFVPGWPWNRPFVLRAHAGAAVLFPGWLAYTIAPVHPDHDLTLARVGLTRRWT